MTKHEQIFSSSNPVVVTFAAGWCKPCARMKPIMDELEGQIEGVDFIRVNIETEEGAKLGALFGVRTVPFFGIVNQGEIASVQPGSATKEHMFIWIESTAEKF